MALYPITTLTPATASVEPNLLPSGTLFVIPIDMTTVNMTQLTLNQMSNTQDYSMRAWVSQFPDGIPLPSSVGTGIYPVMKWDGLPIVVYLSGQTPPENTYSIEVPSSGIYNLNVLNLTNMANYFGFSKTDLA